MKKITTFFLIIILFMPFSSCTSTKVPVSGNIDIPEDFLGLVHAGNPRRLDEYQLINEMGAVWLLQTFYWSSIEKEKDKFNFDWYDRFVDAAKLNNKKVVAVMAYETDWIKEKKENYISPENIPHFLNYLEATVKHFKGRVDVWQIWNEPNFKFWKGTKKEFYELSIQAAQRIREADPDAYIIGGGYSRVPKSFIRGMQKAGCFKNTDAISFHPYAVSPGGAMRLHDDFIKINNDFGFKGEIWITEMGYPTDGWYPHKVSLEKLPSYVIKTIVGAAIRNPRALLWYEFVDSHNPGEEPNNHDSEMFFGLTYPNRTRKNGSYSYQLCSNYLPGSRYNPALPLRENIPSNIFSFCFTKEKSNVNTLILWNDKNNSFKIGINLPSSSFKLHNISTGENKELQNGTVLDVSNIPVFITWQGESTVSITRVKQ